MSENDASANAVSDAVGMRGRERPFGGLTPSEAAQRRWSEVGEQQGDTLTPLAKTRSALERKAGSGDVQAARELREHAGHYYGSATAGTAWTELLTEEENAAVSAIITRALARDEPPDWPVPEPIKYVGAFDAPVVRSGRVRPWRSSVVPRYVSRGRRESPARHEFPRPRQDERPTHERSTRGAV